MSDEKLAQFFEWRRQERRKRRIITTTEYVTWLRGGDAISSPSESNPFPGGLKLLFEDRPLVLGQTVRKVGDAG